MESVFDYQDGSHDLISQRNVLPSGEYTCSVHLVPTAAAVNSVWNSLLVELRAPDISQTVFRNKLKTYLFDIT